MSKHSFNLTVKAETILQDLFTQHGLTDETETKNWEKLFAEILPSLILYKNSPPSSENPSEQKPDSEHLNIDQKDGAIQIYLRKREARLELRKEHIADVYLVEHARQKAKVEGDLERAKIKEEFANRERFQKRYIQSGKPKVYWGNSEGVDGFELGDR